MNKPLSYPAAFVLTVLLYVAAFWYSTQFASVPGKVVPIWPPAGVALAAFVLFGYRIWPALTLSLVLCHYFMDPVSLRFLVYAGASGLVAPFVGTWFLRRKHVTNLYAVSVRNGFLWLGASALSSLAGSVIGISGMLHDGMITLANLPPSWLQWWLGNTCGIVACMPGIITLVHQITHKDRRSVVMTFAHLSEKLIWFCSLAATFIALHWIRDLNTPFSIAVIFPPLALLLWSALRFPPLYTFVGVTVVSLVIIYYFGLGRAGFPMPETYWDFTLLLMLLTTMIMMPQVVAASTFERQCFARELHWRANHDPLTGMLNRNAFEAMAGRILGRKTRLGENIALCYLDLDQFKVVNDTCGHAVGDHFVKQVATLLEENMATGDIVARLGGDEFAILMRNCLPAEAMKRAERIRGVIDEHRFVWKKRIFAFSVSIGVVAGNADQSNFSRLLSEADTACYTAKELGRNRIKMRTEDDLHLSRSHDQMEWAVRITEALELNQFRLFCQSISPVTERNETGMHFEVLLRMVDRKNELLMPGAFIPAAERFHLMTKIDRWVVHNTLAWLSDHPRYLKQVGLCSINLSGASLGDTHFHEFLSETLEKTTVPVGKLCFEITETAAIGDLNHAVKLIKAVKQMGCKFALDDFGSGLASFNYLKTLHVDYLKIDGAFVRELPDAPTDLAMVRSINEVGHLMKKKTIAEYVENEQIMNALETLGIDYAQGHTIGEPMPIDEFFAVQIRNHKQVG